MKRFFFLLILLISPSLVYAQPSIEFDTRIHDFGVVIQEDMLQYSFNFTNTGNEELKIEKLISS